MSVDAFSHLHISLNVVLYYASAFIGYWFQFLFPPPNVGNCWDSFEGGSGVSFLSSDLIVSLLSHNGIEMQIQHFKLFIMQNVVW